ncbi:MAG: flavodoxin family protein [Methanoregula sp.]|nr:MAG: flavodoxin family protein [Methanoregula sp.]
MELVFSREISTHSGSYTIIIEKEDFSVVYPGMIRYTLSLLDGKKIFAVFRTNTYEYSPTVIYRAEKVIFERAQEWEQDLVSDPERFLKIHATVPPITPLCQTTDVVVLQGSPRADGNCSIIVGFVVAAAKEIHKTVQVIYPHDMNIHSCIGCYQCYNTGTCTFDDDMGDIINAFQHASLIIVCSPVYTNSVPGALKLLIDRCQAYHAQLTISKHVQAKKKGLIFSVAGRKGRSHFACVINVVAPFFRNIGIQPSGELLIDGVDELQDIRKNRGLEHDVRRMVHTCLMEM